MAVPTPTDPASTADRAATPSRQVVDRVTSGKRFSLRGDGRSREARRLRGLYRGFRGELGRTPSSVEETLLRDAAGLALELEVLDDRSDPAERVRLSYALRDALRALGLGAARPAPEPTREERAAAAMAALGIAPRR